MACVDIYQALTESRPYKQGMPHEKAYGILNDMVEKGWLDGEIASQVDACFDQKMTDIIHEEKQLGESKKLFQIGDVAKNVSYQCWQPAAL